MLAIVETERTMDIDELAKKIKKSLPYFAHPVFVRILPEIEMTGTFKLKKMDLQKEGYDVTKISDPIYYMQKNGSYKLMTKEIFEKIVTGKCDL